jgi:hypothetical protein
MPRSRYPPDLKDLNGAVRALVRQMKPALLTLADVERIAD